MKKAKKKEGPANRGLAARVAEVEKENNTLANLYVASYQLHSALDLKEVLRILREILTNLIGAERFTIMILDEVTTELTAVLNEGMDAKRLKKIKAGDGVIGEVARTGRSYFEPDVKGFEPAHDWDPFVCIPLKIKERVIGILAIFSLLEQKGKRLSPLDYELLSMLAGHAATAIFASKLYSAAERKPFTFEGIMDLLGEIK